MKGGVKFLYIALIAGVVIRIVLLWLAASDPGVLSHSDQRIYIDLAEHLRRGGGFGAGFGTERLPVYPIFLALCFEVAQIMGLTAHKLMVAAVVQNVVGLMAVPAIYSMGRIFSRDTANFAAGFAAINLNMAVYSTQLLTEALFYPFFAYGLLAMFRYRMRGETRRIFAAAVVFGFCTLIRPVTMFLPLFIIPYLLIERKVRGWMLKVAHVVIFTAVFIAAISPWLIRNHNLYGHAVLTGQGVPHIVGWVLPSVTRYEKGMDLTQAMDEETAKWAEYEKGLPQEVRENPMALSEEAKSYGFRHMLEASPVSISMAWFWGAVKNLFAPVAVELAYILDMKWSHFTETPGKGFLEQAFNFLFHNENKLYSYMLTAGILLTFAFRLIQLAGAKACAKSKPGLLPIGMLIVIYFLLVSGPVGYAKYRLPYEPFFILFTALALDRWLNDPGLGRRRSS